MVIVTSFTFICQYIVLDALGWLKSNVRPNKYLLVDFSMVGFVNSPPVYQGRYDPRNIYEPYYGKGLNQECYLHTSGNLRGNLRIT